MPNRILKESICSSDNMNSLTLFQENTFFRLIVNCDDYGRMDARPAIVKAKLYPLKDYRLDQIEDALRALASAELVILYEVDGKPFLQMKTWDRHQTIRAKKSKYPSPDDVKTFESNCKQMQADASKCSRNPIQSESESNTNVCVEVNSAPAAPPVITMPCLKNETYDVIQEDYEKDKATYPAVDVMEQYKKMKRWLETNKRNLKTKNGMPRFINSWLAKEQNRGGRSAARTQTNQQSAKFDYGTEADYDEYGFPIGKRN